MLISASETKIHRFSIEQIQKNSIDHHSHDKHSQEGQQTLTSSFHHALVFAALVFFSRSNRICKVYKNSCYKVLIGHSRLSVAEACIQLKNLTHIKTCEICFRLLTELCSCCDFIRCVCILRQHSVCWLELIQGSHLLLSCRFLRCWRLFV